MKRIGEVLIENGSITQEQLAKALAQQKQGPGKLLGQILIEMGLVIEEDIVVALATQFNTPYLPIGNFDLTKTREGLLPKELIQKYRCIPLERIGNLLTIVTADPTNDQAIREIEEVSKCRVQIFVATDREIATVILQHFHIDVSDGRVLKEELSQVPFQLRSTQKTEDQSAHNV